MTGTVGNPELRRDALRILAAGLAAVDPVRLVADALVDDPTMERWSHEIASSPPATAAGPPATGGRTLLVSVGKAALGMTRGALQVLGDAVDEGIVLVPREAGAARPGWLPPQIRLRTGSHPLPDADTVETAREVAALARGAEGRDRLLVLISGGGSALLTLPREGVELDDVRATTRLLLADGAPIEELNAVRGRLEVLKDGGLARLAGPARILGLVLSDVVGDDPAVVASGPLTLAPRSPRESETLLRRRGIWDQLPTAAQRALAAPRGRGGEAGGPSRPVADLGADLTVSEGPDPEVRVVGGGVQAMDAAAARARSLGYRTHRLTRALQGEARRAGRGLARVGMAVQDGVAPPAPPACLLAAGETTVTVTGPGRGGRNQEVALGAALALSGREGILVASLGTDGIDGPTDAAGGFGDGSTRRRAAEAGMDVETALRRNDAYPLLDALGDLIRTGPTGTNVADLMLVLVGPPPGGGA